MLHDGEMPGERPADTINEIASITGLGATVTEITPEDAEIARLAALDMLYYDREREAAAKALGCRAAILDKLVAAERGKAGGGKTGTDTAGQGRPLTIADPEPWPDPVDGAVLLGEIAATIRRYVVLPPPATTAAALWVVGTYLMTCWYIFPRLFVTAPESECGKSTLLDVLARLSCRAIAASSVSAPSLFRTIEAARPALFLDEADTYLTSEHEDLRGVVDAGFCRTGAVIRTVGEDHEPRLFSCWAAVALAAIGRIPGTVESRSIIIHLVRRLMHEVVESFRPDRAQHLDTVARKIARWARDHAVALAAADPAMPPGVYNRAADNWRPLLAVADAAGGEWPERARAAVAALSGREESLRALLLADIRAAFETRQADRLASDEIVSYLVELDDRPWPEFSRGKPLSKNSLARLLKPFGVFSGSIRFDDGRTPKGYYRGAFDDAFARYLPRPSDQNATPPQPSKSAALGGFQNATDMNGVAFSNRKNPSISAACGGVAFSNPPDGVNSAMRPSEPPQPPPRAAHTPLGMHVFEPGKPPVFVAAREPGEDADDGAPAWDGARTPPAGAQP